jgi:nucleoprotein TPR
LIENACSSLESQVQNFKSSSSTSSSELQTLRSRISSLEASNRDTVALLESKSTGHDRLAHELSDQHQKTVDLRREISLLEQSIQNSSSAASTAKFKQSNLQQELDLVRKSNEWYEAELKTKSGELTKTRKEKGAKISELQRLNEDCNSTIGSLRRTETTLRNRLEDITQKADGSFAKIQQLQDDAAKQNEDNRREVDSAKRLATLLESTLDQTKARLREVDEELRQIREEAANQIGAVEAERDTEKTARDAAEQRVNELEENSERLENELSSMRNASSVPGTPTRGLSGTSFLGRAGSPVNRLFSKRNSKRRNG